MAGSKSGKVIYLCGKCRGPNIARCMVHGQQSYACDDCNAWFPWPSRIKLSAKSVPSDKPTGE